ncbi:MAG TPA: acyltransferase [Cytophagales bacterium]|nr:acyltransferase [Cytophagales bacterium]
MQRKLYFENLDALRTIACLTVIIGHTLKENFYKVDAGDFFNRILHLVSSGNLGVAFFFSLSGYLITYLILIEKESKGKFSLKNFYIRRTLRIWPLFLTVVIFGLYLYPFVKSLLGISTELANRPIYYFLFLSNFDHLYLSQNNLLGQSALMLHITWSVAIEEQFYLIWPLLFYIFPSQGTIFIFLSVIAASIIFKITNINDGHVLYFHTFSVMGYLALGGLLGYFSFNSTRFISVIEGLNKKIILLVYFIGLGGLLYSDLIFSFYYGPVFSYLFQAVFFGFVILEQNFTTNSPLKFKQIYVFSILGKYTYGLYLLHPIGILIVSIIVRVLHLEYTSFYFDLLSFGFVLLFSLAISYVSYHYFESYFLKLKHKFAYN